MRRLVGEEVGRIYQQTFIDTYAKVSLKWRCETILKRPSSCRGFYRCLGVYTYNAKEAAHEGSVSGFAERGRGENDPGDSLGRGSHQDGKQVFLVDLDPQASASFWMDTWEDDGLAITAIPASRLGHVLERS